MADFLLAYNKTMAHEGGYANHPKDKGGETYRGIARKFHPNWIGWETVDKMKSLPNFPANLKTAPFLSDFVMEFYRTEFWGRLGLDGITSQALCEELFDTSVHASIHFGRTSFQEAVWLLGHNIKIDGIINPDGETVKAANKCNWQELLLTLNVLQGERYKEICKSNPDQRVFFRGWLKRVTL